MARIDWVEQRLQNWARCKLMRGSGVLGYAAVDLTKLADADSGRDGYITASIPVSEIEASDTDQAVLRLPSELRATVEMVYVDDGTLKTKCARLCVTESTLHRRVEQAHRHLAEHWTARKAAQQAERARLEDLAEQARRTGGFYARE